MNVTIDEQKEIPDNLPGRIFPLLNLCHVEGVIQEIVLDDPLDKLIQGLTIEVVLEQGRDGLTADGEARVYQVKMEAHLLRLLENLLNEQRNGFINQCSRKVNLSQS